MNFKNFTFLIHGGGLSDKTYGQKEARPTHALINSIRKYFPESSVVLSTWDTEPYKQYIENIDYIVLGPDPGVTWASKELKVTSAINRHIISTKNGLPLVQTKYVVVIRNDLEFINSRLKSFLSGYFSKNKNSKKIVALAGGTLDEFSNIRKPFLFHICDFLYIGDTEKLKFLFDTPNELDSFFPKMYFEKNSKPIFKKKRWNDTYLQRWIPESFVIKYFADKIGHTIPNSSYDFSLEYRRVSRKIIKDHFYLADRKKLGVIWFKNKNRWQTGLKGILGRYTNYLYLSRQSNFILLKATYLLLHYMKIIYRMINYIVYPSDLLTDFFKGCSRFLGKQMINFSKNIIRVFSKNIIKVTEIKKD